MGGSEANFIEPNTIWQAIYTWAEVLPSGKQGEGFIAASPSLAKKIGWLDASCTPLIGYIGNSNKVSPEQSAAYKPVGKHIHTDKTFIYRKQDFGHDGLGREGNYLIHYLIADSSIVCLSDVLRIKSSAWDLEEGAYTHGSNRGKLQSMPEIRLSRFRDQLIPFAEFKEPDLSVVKDTLFEMARTDILDVTHLDLSIILGMLSVLPCWADYSIELIPEWSDHGAVRRLRLMDRRLAISILEDRRLDPVNDDFEGLRRKLAGIRTADGLRSSIREFAKPKSLSPGSRKAESAELSLDECIEKWLKRSEPMTREERDFLIEVQAEQIVNALAEQERSLPTWRNHNDIALALLERCEEIDRKLLGAIMPRDDESVCRYVAACSNSAVLEAVVWLNGDESRQIDIEFPKGVATTTLIRLVKLCTEQLEFHQGLVRSVQISFFGAGSFVRRLLRNPGMDYQYLYSRVLPDAAAGDSELLWALASVNPEVYVALLASSHIHEIYSEALISALRKVGSQSSYGSVSSLTERWRTQEAASHKADFREADKLGSAKMRRASSGKTAPKPRRWRRKS